MSPALRRQVLKKSFNLAIDAYFKYLDCTAQWRQKARLRQQYNELARQYNKASGMEELKELPGKTLERRTTRDIAPFTLKQSA